MIEIPERYSNFLRAILDYSGDRGSVTYFEGLLALSQEQRTDSIAGILEELRGYSFGPFLDNVSADRINRGLQIIRYHADAWSSIFPQLQAVFIYGSLLYRDPVNLDADLVLEPISKPFVSR